MKKDFSKLRRRIGVKLIGSAFILLGLAGILPLMIRPNIINVCEYNSKVVTVSLIDDAINERLSLLADGVGYDKLVKELEDLRTVKRKEVADKIKVARGYGDLSENAEYDAAKEEQASVEARIADLEATLKLARIMDESELSADTMPQ